MSELKIHKIADLCFDFKMGKDVGIDFYLKFEADKVIADLEDKLRAANEQIENLINSASSIMLFQDRVNDNKCDELRHNKYKRCLAMAMWCNERHTFNETNEKRTWLHKWHKRWLELAEKFKPNKEAK